MNAGWVQGGAGGRLPLHERRSMNAGFREELGDGYRSMNAGWVQGEAGGRLPLHERRLGSGRSWGTVTAP